MSFHFEKTNLNYWFHKSDIHEVYKHGENNMDENGGFVCHTKKRSNISGITYQLSLVVRAC